DGAEPYANPRNLTAGTLKLLDPRLAAGRKLQLFAYGLGACEGATVRSHLEGLELLRQLGLPVKPPTRSFGAIDEVIAYCEDWAAKRTERPYAPDGVDIKVNAYDQRRRMGVTSKAPRWAVAFKFAAEQAMTRLLGITVDVGKQGTLTPVARLQPVRLAGTTVA